MRDRAMPITIITVMVPNGNTITAKASSGIGQHSLAVDGLRFGPLRLESEEIWALKDILNTMYDR